MKAVFGLVVVAFMMLELLPRLESTYNAQRDRSFVGRWPVITCPVDCAQPKPTRRMVTPEPLETITGFKPDSSSSGPLPPTLVH